MWKYIYYIFQEFSGRKWGAARANTEEEVLASNPHNMSAAEMIDSENVDCNVEISRLFSL